VDRLAEDVVDVKWKDRETEREFELPPPSCCSCCASPPPKNKVTLTHSEFKKEEMKKKIQPIGYRMFIFIFQLI